MRVVIIGAGPAGLYVAYLLKRAFRWADVQVHERRARGTTFGFGIVFSDKALDFLVAEDSKTHALLAPELEQWSDLTIVHRGERVVIDGIGFSAIGRQMFLDLLEVRALDAGVEIHYDSEVDAAVASDRADLVVAADGVGSGLRQEHATAFGTSEEPLNNRFIWFGTSKPFDTLTQTFLQTRHGAFNAHHYRYQPHASTFIVETHVQTWRDAGLADLPIEASIRFCETVFAEALQGHRLVSNNSHWRQFPVVRNRTWSHGNIVLIGDALHTAHYSIGSGTRLALEDAIALAAAVKARPHDIGEALGRYQSERQPILQKLLGGADASAAWYESFEKHMQLAPYDFAMSYINRSGRVDQARLKAMSPGFVANYEANAA